LVARSERLAGGPLHYRYAQAAGENGEQHCDRQDDQFHARSLLLAAVDMIALLRFINYRRWENTITLRWRLSIQEWSAYAQLQ